MSNTRYGEDRARPPKPVSTDATTLHVVIQRVKINYKSEMKVIVREGGKKEVKSPGSTEVRAVGAGSGRHRGNKMTHRRKASRQQARSIGQRHAASLRSCLGVRSAGPDRGWHWVRPGKRPPRLAPGTPGMGHPLVPLSSFTWFLKGLSEVKIHDVQESSHGP